MGYLRRKFLGFESTIPHELKNTQEHSWTQRVYPILKAFNFELRVASHGILSGHANRIIHFNLKRR